MVFTTLFIFPCCMTELMTQVEPNSKTHLLAA